MMMSPLNLVGGASRSCPAIGLDGPSRYPQGTSSVLCRDSNTAFTGVKLHYS